MKVNPLTTNEIKIDHLHSSMNQSDAFNGLIVDNANEINIHQYILDNFYGYLFKLGKRLIVIEIN